MSKLKIFVGEEHGAWTYGQAVVAARTAEEAQEVFELDRALVAVGRRTTTKYQFENSSGHTRLYW